MAQFDVATVSESLDWTFEPVVKGARGKVPEPTDKQIGDFLDGLKSLYTSALNTGMEQVGELPEQPTPDQMLQALNSVTGEAFVKVLADMAGLYSALCSGKPSQEQMLGLPLRYRVHFYSWLMQEVINPEAGPGAGIAEVRSLPSAVTG
jgi:hypothetical protein